MQTLARRRDDRHQPQLWLIVELEELPQARIIAESFEDEQRLRRWVGNRHVRRRVFDALLDVLDEISVSEAA